MTPKKRARPLWRLTLVAVLGLLALNALVFVAFTLPRLNRSRRAEDQATTLRQRLATERAETERLRQRAQAIEANVRDARRFFSETIRPVSEALAADLDAVESAVRASGLNADRRGYTQQPVQGAPLLRYDIRLPLTGPRAQTSVLLRALERAPRFIVIDRIGVQDDRDVGQARFDVDLSTYYQLEAAGQPKAPAKRVAAASKGAQRR
jgi:Tfp pilus assembly protein PilO